MAKKPNPFAGMAAAKKEEAAEVKKLGPKAAKAEERAEGPAERKREKKAGVK